MIPSRSVLNDEGDDAVEEEGEDLTKVAPRPPEIALCTWKYVVSAQMLANSFSA